MDGEELLEVDHPVAVLVEIFEGLGDEYGGAALVAQLREDEVLELVLGQDLEEEVLETKTKMVATINQS